MKQKLNMGSGDEYMEGFVNLDNNSQHKVDVLHDLNKFPYPFKDNSFEFIYASNILEHLDDVPAVMKELCRIAKPNAQIEVQVPHWSHFSTWRDVTHKRGFTTQSFDNFRDRPEYHNIGCRIDILKVELETFRQGSIFLRKFINWLINRNHYWTEVLFSKFFSCSEVRFRLKVLK